MVERQGSVFRTGVGVVEGGGLCWLGEGFGVKEVGEEWDGGGGRGCFLVSNADTIFLTLPNITANSQVTHTSNRKLHEH